MRRLVMSAVLFGALVAALTGIAAPASPAAAGTVVIREELTRAAPPAQTPPPRPLDRSDWEARVPLFLGATLLVIAVDVAFAIKAISNRRAQTRGRRQQDRP